MTKSPRSVAREALRLAQGILPTHSSQFSRKDFTQHPLFAVLAVKTVLGTDYRGVVAFLNDFSELRDDLGLRKVPDHSTPRYAEQRLLKGGLHRPPLAGHHLRTGSSQAHHSRESHGTKAPDLATL